MYKATKRFLWFEEGDDVDKPQQNWIDDGLVVEDQKEVPVKEEVSLDLDGDGDIDEDDRSIAGRVLSSGRRKSARRKKNK